MDVGIYVAVFVGFIVILVISGIINIIRFIGSIFYVMWKIVRWVLPVFLMLPLSFANGQNALGPGMYDQDVPQIVYSGIVWTTTNDSNNYQGYRRGTGLTTSTAPRIDFNIWGDGFDLFITRVSAGGSANVCINGTCQSLSWFSGSTQYVIVSYTGLGYGTHNISIQKTSTTNDAINLDAIYVYPPPLPPTPTGTQGVWILNYPEMTEEPTPRYQQSLDIGGIDSVVQYVINPFDVVMTFLLVVMVIFTVLGLVVNMQNKNKSG